MREVVFVDFARTAFGNRGGALRSFADVDLGAACLKALAEKSGIWEKGRQGSRGLHFLRCCSAQ